MARSLVANAGDAEFLGLHLMDIWNFLNTPAAIVVAIAWLVVIVTGVHEPVIAGIKRTFPLPKTAIEVKIDELSSRQDTSDVSTTQVEKAVKDLITRMAGVESVITQHSHVLGDSEIVELQQAVKNLTDKMNSNDRTIGGLITLVDFSNKTTQEVIDSLSHRVSRLENPPSVPPPTLARS